ncbi:MAG: hypothetical protein ACK53L_16395, partial [Pirellulaceae bacterium]
MAKGPRRQYQPRLITKASVATVVKTGARKDQKKRESEVGKLRREPRSVDSPSPPGVRGGSEWR